MKIKFNFGILKNKKVQFEEINYNNDKVGGYCGIIEKIKEKNGTYRFTFDNGYVLEITDIILSKMLITKDEELITFTYDSSNKKLSGLIGFAMSDTYGFPIELTEEILSEKGYELDMEGYCILKQLQKDLSAGTFKTKDGWNN